MNNEGKENDGKENGPPVFIRFIVISAVCRHDWLVAHDDKGDSMSCDVKDLQHRIVDRIKGGDAGEEIQVS
jgi:hypothetical protein